MGGGGRKRLLDAIQPLGGEYMLLAVYCKSGKFNNQKVLTTFQFLLVHEQKVQQFPV